jgi:hypothetical protein
MAFLSATWPEQIRRVPARPGLRNGLGPHRLCCQFAAGVPVASFAALPTAQLSSAKRGGMLSFAPAHRPRGIRFKR